MSFLREIIYKLRGEVSTSTLLKRGMSIGKNFHRMNGVWIDPGHAWLISMGDDVTIAPKVTILAHDASPQAWRCVTKIGSVKIGSRVFIGAGSIILPGVRIGNDVIIAAGSIVTSTIPNNCIVGGNPAKKIMDLSVYLERIDKIDNYFDSPFDYFPNISSECCKMQQFILETNRFALLGKKKQ